MKNIELIASSPADHPIALVVVIASVISVAWIITVAHLDS